MLLTLALKATLLLSGGFVLTGALHRASAASRHAVWVAVCVALLVLPAGSWLLPTWPVLSRPDRAAPQAVVSASTVQPPHVEGPDLSVQTGETWSTRTALTRPLGLLAGAIWALGLVGCLSWIFAGIIGTRRIERAAMPLDDDRVRAHADEAGRWLGVRRSVRWLSVSADVMPVTWGATEPRVLLPDAARRWSDERLDAVLTHELSHVARRDAVSHLVAQLAAAVWWWHPLAWLAMRQARLERERACDDLVLARGARASDYAADLVGFVAALRPSMVRLPATLAMARRSQLERRVMAILDDGINRRGVSQSGVLAALLVMAIVWPLSAAGPAVATSPAQVRVGGQVREPVKIKDVKPAYPESAKAAGMQGIVIMEIRVDSDGSVVDAKVLRPIGEPLDSAAMDAVLQWRFMPTLLNGSPVEILMTVTINFRLDGGEQAPAQPGGQIAQDLPAATPDPITWSPGDPPLRVGGAVKEPKKLKDVKPAYPADAMAAGISGIVILEIQINEDGLVDEATVLRSIELLDEAARAAVLQWKFVPTVVNGVPAPVVMTVTVNFTL